MATEENINEEVIDLDAPQNQDQINPPVLEDEVIEEGDGEAVLEPKKVHPLAPGGRRFEQVYAQGKQAQRDAQAEREKRIAAEAKLEMLVQNNRVPEPVAKEYTWDDLEAMIATGQITRADANRHREEVVTKQVTSRIKNEFQTETEVTNRTAYLGKTVYDYVVAVPDLSSTETPIRQRVDKEFDWLVAVQGRDVTKLSPIDRKVIEVTALRNVLGPLESLSKRLAGSNTEPHQGIVHGQPPIKRANPDQKLLDELTPRQVEHYQKQFRSGLYPGKWKDVVAELKSDPKAVYLASRKK